MSQPLPVSHVRQRRDGDCVAACASMALDYIGRPTWYRRLLRLLRTVTIGTPFGNVRYLEKLGVTVEQGRGTVELLVSVLQEGYPIIVSVDTKELPYWKDDVKHAVLVVGIDTDRIKFKFTTQLSLMRPSLCRLVISIWRG